MAHHQHTPFPTTYAKEHGNNVNDDADSMRGVLPPQRDHHRSSASSGETSDNEHVLPADQSEPHISILGPKLTRVSDAPWEGSDPLLDDEDDLDNGLDTLSLFGGSKRGRAIDWKRPFAHQSRSSSASRPSQDFGPITSSKSKSGLGIYGNSYASRSAASLSVYSITSGKDVFAANDAPPVPVHLAPATTMYNGPRLRTASAGASTRSSVLSAVSSKSHNSSSGNEVPPMPFPRGFDHVDSTQGASHPYANLDLVGSKPSLYRTDTTNSTQDDGMSLMAPSLTHTSATRSPRSPRSPLSGANLTNMISAPMPAPPGALQGLAMPGPWANGSGNLPSYSLISLEQAQAQQRAKSAGQRSVSNSPAVSTFPISSLPFDPSFAERERQRKASLGTPGAIAPSSLPPEPVGDQGSSSQGHPVGKFVKPRRSGFLKLLRGGGKDKDTPSVSPLDINAPAVPPLPSVALKSTAILPADKRPLASPSDSGSPGALSTTHSSGASPVGFSVRRVPPPSLSPAVTPSASPVKQEQPGRIAARGLAVDVSLSVVRSEVPPQSAPPRVATFDAPLQVRPISTLFSGLPKDMFNRGENSPASPAIVCAGANSTETHASLKGSTLTPTPEEVENWRATIASLEKEVSELRAQMADMRASATSAVCEKCGAHLAHVQSANSLTSTSVTASSFAMSTSSSMSSAGTFASTNTSQSSYLQLHEHLQHSQTISPDNGVGSYDRSQHDSPTDQWRTQGVSVVDRPRARTGGRDRTTFAGMWRD